MKKLKILAIALLAGFLSFTGCTEVEEPDHFRYTVNDYPLQQGFIHNYGMPEGGTGYNFDVTLFSSGISYNRDRHEFQGSGHVVYFQMYSSSATELANGTYQFSSAGDKAPATFDTGNFGMNVNFTDDTGTIVNAVSGVVKVSGSVSEPVFNFSCQTATGEKISGHFSGYAPIYDMRGARK
ncbi:MAG: hypothetical protein RB288_07375 [Bacteroidales bacterium]|jgi:hypothetical protein|nr:hypothetical protein [Bacteroidales bacterium]